jgi:hypothetical protein
MHLFYSKLNTKYIENSLNKKFMIFMRSKFQCHTGYVVSDTKFLRNFISSKEFRLNYSLCQIEIKSACEILM